VIVVSAYAPEADSAGRADGGAAEAGLQPFFETLLKPVHYEELRSALQRALALRHTA
jgi:CheY-like chemotaxis protein